MVTRADYQGLATVTRLAPTGSNRGAGGAGVDADAGDPASSRRGPRSRRALTTHPLRLVVLDRDTGFVAVLSRRMNDLSWEHSSFGAVLPPERLLGMRLDAIVIDVELPGAKSRRWLEALAGAPERPSLIVCSGASRSGERVRALRLGIDDWLGKPCHPEELIARIEAVVRQRRRFGSAQEEPIIVGEIEVRAREYQAYARGVSLELTRREFQLLEALAGEPDTMLRREAIFERVWGRQMPRDDRSVDVLVHKVRRKLLQASPAWRYIHTHPAVGYSLTPARAETGLTRKAS